jgi:hypothetical protein
MSTANISITQLLKDPHSVQEMIDKNYILEVFSRSELVFEIHPPSNKKSTKRNKRNFKLPKISVPLGGKLDRKSLYDSNSWLDR